MQKIAYLCLGSNIKDKKNNIETAIELIKREKKIKINKTSSIYFTEPVGFANQSWFLNQVIEVSTLLYPFELLKILQKIEKDLGRKNTFRWGPRVIDIDILFYSNLIIKSKELTIPHAQIASRKFVLLPMLELVGPTFMHPLLNKTIKELYDELKEEEKNKVVRLYD